MRLLIGVITVAALIWAGLWFWGAQTLRTSLADWERSARAQGITLSYASQEIAGFPNRLDTTVTDLTLDLPRDRLTLAATRAAVYALTYRPHHLIGTAQALTLTLPELEAGFGAGEASLVLRPSPDLPLDRLIAILEDVTLALPADLMATAPQIRIALRQAPAAETSYDLAIVAETPVLAGGSGLDGPFETLRADLTLTLDRPLNRHLDGAAPRLTALEVKTLEAAQGTLRLGASGRLTLDRAGLPSGALDVTVSDWPRLAALVPEFGDVDAAGEAPLAVTLRFAEGQVFLGPVPLGPAPRLR